MTGSCNTEKINVFMHQSRVITRDPDDEGDDDDDNDQIPNTTTVIKNNKNSAAHNIFQSSQTSTLNMGHNGFY